MSAKLTAKRSASSSDAPSSLQAGLPGLVLLDTNALMLPFAGGFPLEEEVRRICAGRTIAIPRSVLGELDRLIARGTANARAAREFAARFAILATPSRGDLAILRVAQAGGHWVVTSDRALRERLRSAGVTVLCPSGHRQLVTFLPRRPPGSPREASRATLVPHPFSKKRR